ncbi:MAG: FixH family protein [Candidatus Accumulibacter sp.]|jgi:hypothetical protein|nr:FixH family protein [Accumulibacter sp.]
MNGRLNAGARPWYREPWPWLLMLGPAVVIVAGFVTAYLAVVSNDGLVEDDYYKQGLTVNQRTARDQRAAELGIAAELVLGAGGERIRAVLRGSEGFRLPAALSLRIAHPTRPGFDQKVLLRAEGGGVYAGTLIPLHGRWHMVLEDDTQEWRLVGDWEIAKQDVLRLTASAAAVSQVN